MAQTHDRIHETATITSMNCVKGDMYVMAFDSPSIASRARPGQFVNIRVNDSTSPLLRRPFSISRLVGSTVEILFQRIGLATHFMAGRRPGDTFDVLGPLGNNFHYDAPCDTAILVAGGVGIAPMPFLTDYLVTGGRKIRTFLGARSKENLYTSHLHNIVIATDDGSQGYHGTVIDLLRKEMKGQPVENIRIYACGPTSMLKALSVFAHETGIPSEASLEGEMGCGIGLCQGCPVEMADGEKRYQLVCNEGTVFPLTSIRL
jgi:dihydroorotate dehydrogenase electron transfer subunit